MKKNKSKNLTTSQRIKALVKPASAFKKRKKKNSNDVSKIEKLLKNLEFHPFKKSDDEEQPILKIYAGGGDGFDKFNDPYGGD